MKKKYGLAVIAVMSATLLGACSPQPKQKIAVYTEGLDDFGKIEVITREAGSGTRDVFAEQLGLLNTASNQNQSDLITESAKIAMNAQAVIDEVKKERTAIGYLSLGALPDNEDKVKQIKLSSELGRNFNLAYSGKLSDVENDFLNYIMTEGQNIVAEHYIGVDSPSTFLSDQSKGKIEIAGSTSVEPLMKELVSEYQKINKNAEIEVKASDSTSGLTAAMQGSCDFGMASRELKEYEKELLQYKMIAKDTIAVIVNAENPTEVLNISQLAEIYSGKDAQWSDINRQ